MMLFLIMSGGYGLICLLAFVFFLVGRSPALIERNWPWPVIFLWPLLVFWVVHAIAGPFRKWKTREQNRTETAINSGGCVAKLVPRLNAEAANLAPPSN